MTMYQRIKGADDFYPTEQAIREAIYSKLDEQSRKFGFQRVDMPAIETIKLLTAKSGEEVKQQIFVLEQKGSEELGLRFDLTVPMTRMFVSKQKAENSKGFSFCLFKIKQVWFEDFCQTNCFSIS